MMASDAATLSTARILAASLSDTLARVSASDATSFHRAHGSPSFHRCASAVCAAVRALATRLTSSSAALNAGDPYAGGGPGRNCDGDSSSQVRAWGTRTPIGGIPRALYHMPGPVGIVPVHGAASGRGGGAQAMTRPAASSPSRLPPLTISLARDPFVARSISRSSSLEIEARTAESV